MVAARVAADLLEYRVRPHHLELDNQTAIRYPRASVLQSGAALLFGRRTGPIGQSVFFRDPGGNFFELCWRRDEDVEYSPALMGVD